MKQILQDVRSGELLLQEVAAPSVRPGTVLIRTTRSLISAGTERTLTNFAKANYLQKAMQQPERVRQVWDKARTDGLLATYEAVSAKLDQPIPLGYCNVGRVLAVGTGVSGMAIGDRVASNCPHVEVALAPENLCARIPDSVSDDDAAFTVISSIALQGIRLINPTLGETVVVFGLGLIGLLAVQILRANGCNAIGLDHSADRVTRANAYGARAFHVGDGFDPVATVGELTGGVGADAVLIAASTSESRLISQAAQMSRKRGRIVLTGVVGLDLLRSDFYEKELTFQVSCSYGPGRYDLSYEKAGHDYPLPYVRWTEQRNFQAVLDLMAQTRLNVSALVTNRVPFSDAPQAYALLNDPSAIGILLEYGAGTPDETLTKPTIRRRDIPAASSPGRGIGILGAGAFAQAKILPALKKSGAVLKTIVSANGTSGSIAARNFDIAVNSTDSNAVFYDGEIGGVVVATPHNRHADEVIESLKAGKHVFVEKPLCISEEELARIASVRREISTSSGSVPIIMVGFNRRYAPLALAMRRAAAARSGPAFTAVSVNAGFLAPDHWTQNPDVGGGRLVGEGCHFIDFVQFLTGSAIVRVFAAKQMRAGLDLEDNLAIVLSFADGSIGQVNYFACGNKGFPKEHCIMSFDGKTLSLDNFRSLAGYGIRGVRGGLGQDKGHALQFETFVKLIGSDGPVSAPVGFPTIENVMRATFAAARSMREGVAIDVQQQSD